MKFIAPLLQKHFLTNAFLVYDGSTSRWRDQNPFGTAYGDIALDGGSF